MVGLLKRMRWKHSAPPAPPTQVERPHPHRAPFADRWWTVDGLRLHARDYAPGDGDARVPVICLHGLTRNAADFEDLAPVIAATGRRVVAVDVRGRGKSQWDPDPYRYHPGTYAQDVIELMQALGIARAVFIGTSMGGLIAMVLASLRPDMIEAAVLNDVGLRVAPGGLARIMAAVGRHDPVADWADAADYARLVNGDAFPGYGPQDWRAFAHRLFEPDGHGRLRLAYDPEIATPITAGAGLPAPDMTPWFLALTAGRRTLLVHGAQSDVLDAATVNEMQLLAPSMDYALVPGVGHAPTLMEPPALAAVSALLDQAG